MKRSASARQTSLDLELDADELLRDPRRASTLGLSIVRLDELGVTPIREDVVEALRARVAKRAPGRAKKART